MAISDQWNKSAERKIKWNQKEKMKEKLLDLEELRKVSGGCTEESWDIEDETNLCFFSAMKVLNKLGINSSFRDGMGAGAGNVYKSATNFLNMSQEQVLHIIRNYK
ncbi:MAG: hypothetical protein IJI66_08900 [Erysipelotrichaceae bacterium]|nr:hypothetical protein [Erysipelotrichaceae bacterium]